MTNFLTDPITTPTTPLLRRRGLHIMEEIKVFVADERHIKYVDTILDTIESCKNKRNRNCKAFSRICKTKNAGKKSNHSIGRRQVRRLLLYRKLEQQTVCSQLGINRRRYLSGTRFSQKNQAQGFRVIPRTISGSQDIRINDWRSSHENK